MTKEWRIAAEEISCGNRDRTIKAGDLYLILVKESGVVKYRCSHCAKAWTPPPVPTELREQLVTDTLAKPMEVLDPAKPEIVTLTSFSYAKGIPENAYVFDVRKSVRNPWKNPSLRKLNGLDREVQEWLKRCSGVSAIVSPATYILRHGKYYKGNYTNNVAIGCQGGRHRSVAIVEMVRKAVKLSGTDKTLTVIHRDLKIKGGSDVNFGVNGGDTLSPSAYNAPVELD